jgi:hypothetical protein
MLVLVLTKSKLRKYFYLAELEKINGKEENFILQICS